MGLMTGYKMSGWFDNIKEFVKSKVGNKKFVRPASSSSSPSSLISIFPQKAKFASGGLVSSHSDSVHTIPESNREVLRRNMQAISSPDRLSVLNELMIRPERTPLLDTLNTGLNDVQRNQMTALRRNFARSAESSAIGVNLRALASAAQYSRYSAADLAIAMQELGRASNFEESNDQVDAPPLDLGTREESSAPIVGECRISPEGEMFLFIKSGDASLPEYLGNLHKIFKIIPETIRQQFLNISWKETYTDPNIWTTSAMPTRLCGKLFDGRILACVCDCIVGSWGKYDLGRWRYYLCLNSKPFAYVKRNCCLADLFVETRSQKIESTVRVIRFGRDKKNKNEAD